VISALSDIVTIQNLTHRYGTHLAVDDVSFSIAQGASFGLLGPNGGGKTTLFKILATLLTPSQGTASIGGHDVVRNRAAVRGLCGVVFQSPSLDPYLTVRENLLHGGHLYGLHGAALESRIRESLAALDVADRAHHLVRTLSGGLKRRVEIAKSVLHRPAVLLLDEPSTGLDPGARAGMWRQLQALRATSGMTLVMTTHYMDEADRCERLGIMDRGRLVALGRPNELKGRIGGVCIQIECDDANAMRDRVASRFNCAAAVVDGSVRIEQAGGHALVPALVDAFGSDIRSVTVGQPTLEDVFMHETGRRFEIE